MKILKISLLIGLLNTSLLLTAQLPVAFKEIRHFPSDTAKWNEIQNLFGSEKFEQAKNISTSFANDCFEKGNIKEFLFINNQAAVNLTVLAKEMAKSTELLYATLDKVQLSEDTLNTEYAMLLKYIATHHFYKYEDDKAIEFYKRGLNLVQSLPFKSVLNIDFQMNLGNMYVNTGKYNLALPHLEISLNTAIKDSIPTVFMLTSQSFGYIASLNDLELALEFYNKIEQVAESIKTEENHYFKYLANICNTMAVLYRGTDSEKKAIEYERKAYNYINKSNINDLYLKTSIYEKLFISLIDNDSFEAQSNFKDSASTYIQKNSLENNQVSIPLYCAMLSYYYKNNQHDSIPSLIKHIENIINTPDIKREHKAYFFNTLAYYSKSDQDKIENHTNAIDAFLPNYSISLRDFDTLITNNVNEPDFNNRLLPALKSLSEIHFKEYTTEGNINDLQICISMLNTIKKCIEVYSKGTIEKNTGLRYSEEYSKVGSKLISALLNLYQIENDKQVLNEIIQTIEDSKAFYLQKQISWKQASKLSSNNKLRNKYLELLMQKNDYEVKLKESLIVKNQHDSLKYKDSLMDLAFKLIKFQVGFNSELELNHSQLKNNTIPSAESLLKDNEAIISYHLSDSILISTITTKDKKSLFKTNVNENFKRLLKKANRDIKTGSEITPEINNELYKLLFEQLESKIIKNNHLIIIPHKEISRIPFEAIKDLNGKYLVKRFSFSYHPSTKLWINSREKNRGKISYISLFSPVFKSNKENINKINYRDISNNTFSRIYTSDRNNLQDLPFSELEVLNIEKLCIKHKIKYKKFTNTEASENNFKKELSNSQIIHIGTHGYVNKKYSELSGMFFAPEKSSDAYIFADELFSLKTDANLVVLSSCNSGDGILEKSEGINSLQKNFLLAGVPNVIASFWKVHDEKTKDLMVAFYKYLLKDNVSYAEALRLAKLECIENGFLPLDWAGFILIGE